MMLLGRLASAMSAATARTRSEIVPSISPITNVLPAAAQHDPWSGHVGAEVHERLDDPGRPDRGGELLGVQPVLQRDHEPVSLHPAGQGGRGGRRVLRLDRDQDRPVQPLRQVGRAAPPARRR